MITYTSIECFKSIVFCIGLALVVSGSAQAVPITYNYAGTGSGTIGTTTFTNTTFVITAVGDTNNRQSFPGDFSSVGGYQIGNISASIDIAGVGKFSFITPTHFFVNNEASAGVGFSEGVDVLQGGTDLFDGPTDPSFLTWDMLSSIGPISGSAELLQWIIYTAPYVLGPHVLTDGGYLVFNDQQTQATFQATVSTQAPEPATLTLLGLGIAGIGYQRRRQMRAQESRG
jgi:hypothetical protein